MTKHQLKQDLEANNPKGECCLRCKGNKKNLWQCKNSACSCHIKLCHQPPDTFNTKECINGHKMTGVGFDDCCPECEEPWKSGLEAVLSREED